MLIIWDLYISDQFGDTYTQTLFVYIPLSLDWILYKVIISLLIDMVVLSDIKTNISVEPVYFLYMLATYIMYYTQSSLIYTKVCASHFDEETCNNLNNDNNTDFLDVVQEESSHWTLWFNLAFGLPAIISCAFIGSWGDMYSRKLAVLLPSVGALLSSVLYVANAALPEAPLYLILISGAVSGICGGNTGMTMGAMSFVSSITNDENRTTRLGILEGLTFFGATIGPLIEGAMIDTTGPVYTFVIVLACHTLSVVYIIIFLKDPKQSMLSKAIQL